MYRWIVLQADAAPPWSLARSLSDQSGCARSGSPPPRDRRRDVHRSRDIVERVVKELRVRPRSVKHGLDRPQQHIRFLLARTRLATRVLTTTSCLAAL